MKNIAPEIVEYFARLIERETGIQYSSTNSQLLENRLREFARMAGYGSITDLWLDIRARGLRTPEKELILDLATNNETSFFRDPDIFEFLRHEFIPKSTTGSKAVRIWSAACSTGQEPYSIAMCFDHLRAQGHPRRFNLLATDISDRVLAQARSGIYSQLEVQRGLSAAQLLRYFDQVKVEDSALARYRIKPAFQTDLTFSRLNLLEPWTHPEKFDLIFCRNVLIYQTIENKKRIIGRLADSLQGGGYLVLGGAESLLGLSEAFELQRFGRACVYKTRTGLAASA